MVFVDYAVRIRKRVYQEAMNKKADTPYGDQNTTNGLGLINKKEEKYGSKDTTNCNLCCFTYFPSRVFFIP